MTAAKHYGQVTDWLGSLMAETEGRHAWMFVAGDQIRRWREEDRQAGMPWADEEKSK